MGPDDRTRTTVVILLGVGEGILAAAGLETCFGIGRYRLIMALGALAGLGLALLGWLWRRWTPAGDRRTGWRLGLAGGLSAAAVFAVWFAWRIAPLIQAELAFSR